MKLIKTLFIRLKVNFQYGCAANTLVPNLKVRGTKKKEKKKRDRNTKKSEQILSSHAGLARHVRMGGAGGGFDLFY